MKRRPGALDDERGTVTAFVVVMTLAMLMAAGLVYDGGTLLATRRLAVDSAASAARAGAQAVSADALRHRDRTIDPGVAAAAAHGHLNRHGLRGTVVVSGDRVRVTVTRSQTLTLLTLVGLQEATVTGTAEARLVRGVTQGET